MGVESEAQLGHWYPIDAGTMQFVQIKSSHLEHRTFVSLVGCFLQNVIYFLTEINNMYKSSLKIRRYCLLFTFDPLTSFQ